MMNKYIKWLMHIPAMRRFKHKVSSAPGTCCISITPNDFSLVHAVDNGEKLEIRVCETVPYEKAGRLKHALSEVVKKHQLQRVNCSWILSPRDYKLLVMEALPVTPAEFQNAIRWKIKDLLPYPVEDVAIDSYPLPKQKQGGPNAMLSIVAARLSYLNQIANQIRLSGLNLTTIDIHELAVRNITALYENDEKTTALIYLQEKYSELFVTHQKTLYFSRRLELGLNQLDGKKHEEKNINEKIDSLSLEIQRSFDYFQSHWREPLPTRLFLASSHIMSNEAHQNLTQRITLPFQALDITKQIKTLQNLTVAEQGRYLPLLGGALREIVENAEAAS